MKRPMLGLLIASHIVDDFYPGAVPVILPFLLVERDYTYTQITGITLAATFLSSILQPLFGVMADRRERRWLIGAGMLVAGLGVGLAGLTDSYWQTWLLVAVSGIGIAAYHPEAARAARAAAGASAQGMSWFAVGGNIGLAAGPLLAAPVLAVTGLGGTPLLALPAIVMALVLVVAWRPVRAESPAPKPKPADGKDDWRAFSWLTTVVMLRSVAYFGVASLIALLVLDRFDVSEQTAAATLTALATTGIAGTVAGGWLADRIGRVRTVRIGYALILPGLLGVLFAPHPSVIFASAVVLGLGLYVPFSVHTTLGQEYLPRRIGTASGVTLGLAVSVGGIVAPLLGMLADAYGITTAFACLTVLPLLTLLASTRLPEPRAAATEETTAPVTPPR